MARRWRPVATALGVCVVLSFLLVAFGWDGLSPRPEATTGPAAGSWLWQQEHKTKLRRPSPAVLASLGLDEETCRATFPGLMDDIDGLVSLGPFTLRPARNDGPLQVRIQDGQLYVIHVEDKESTTRGMLDARTAALHQLHRAVITSPSALPNNTVVSVNVMDDPASESWSYSRAAYAASMPGSGAPATRAFLMPHWSFWAWPALPFVGSLARAAAAIDVLEAASPAFARKDPRAVWRGTKRYSSAHHPGMREKLLAATRDGANWADVQELAWEKADPVSTTGAVAAADGTNGVVATNSLPIEHFCRYKYVVHTEGITYSGRLQLLQMCRSVVLTPPIAWLQHTTHLIRPVFSFDLNGRQAATWAASDGERQAWPRRYAAGEANMVFVAPDWSDLRDTVRWLEEHPRVAEGIATRQRDLFVGGGYFSPAAEACYWRALVRGWSEVARTDGQAWAQQPGVRWEEFAMGYESQP